MQHLGQHFLTNNLVLQKIADEILKTSPQTILEIGPGHGELTRALRQASDAKNKDIKIIAIEKDPELVKVLQEKFLENTNVEIIEGDIRKILPEFKIHSPRLAAKAKPSGSKFTLCGNIPYYLTGYLFRLISELEKKPEACVFLIQKEVAERLVAKPPHMNRLAAAVQYFADPKILFHISKDDFTPAPKVESAVIRLDIKPSSPPKEAKRYFALLQTLFAAPRKTILNNLSAKTITMSRETVQKALEKCGIEPGDRPQNLSIQDIEKLAKEMKF